jgi:hypothetical protein
MALPKLYIGVDRPTGPCGLTLWDWAVIAYGSELWGQALWASHQLAQGIGMEIGHTRRIIKRLVKRGIMHPWST